MTPVEDMDSILIVGRGYTSVLFEGKHHQSERSKKDELVISGISCRLPESDNMAEFWDNLVAGVDMVTEDDRRWTPGKPSENLSRSKCMLMLSMDSISVDKQNNREIIRPR